jgi:hypothetical protein
MSLSPVSLTPGARSAVSGARGLCAGSIADDDALAETIDGPAPLSLSTSARTEELRFR